jgi:dTDP-4-dehydrorhamnose reductase
MLGDALSHRLQGRHELFAAGREQFDVADRRVVFEIIAAHKPDWVIHLAALTDVDRCEREPEEARRVNTLGTEYIVAACRQAGAGLLFLSSIAVFDGFKQTPYDEADIPRPINQYGWSKCLAEQAVATLPRHLIVRSGWLFGGVVDKKFVSKILSLAGSRHSLHVVADKVGSPTSVTDLAAGLERLLQEGAQGLYHLVNSGPPVSRYALAQAIVTAAGLSTEILPVASDHFPALAPRPDMEAAVSLHTNGWLPPWREALDVYVATLSPALR